MAKHGGQNKHFMHLKFGLVFVHYSPIYNTNNNNNNNNNNNR